MDLHSPWKQADLHRALRLDVTSEGPRQQDLDKVRDYMLKKHAENQKENSYWSGLMYNYALTGFDSNKNYEKILNGITTSDLKKFAKNLLKQGNVIEVSMVGVE